MIVYNVKYHYYSGTQIVESSWEKISDTSIVSAFTRYWEQCTAIGIDLAGITIIEAI